MIEWNYPEHAKISVAHCVRRQYCCCCCRRRRRWWCERNSSVWIRVCKQTFSSYLFEVCLLLLSKFVRFTNIVYLFCWPFSSSLFCRLLSPKHRRLSDSNVHNLYVEIVYLFSPSFVFTFARMFRTDRKKEITNRKKQTRTATHIYSFLRQTVQKRISNRERQTEDADNSYSNFWSIRLTMCTHDDLPPLRMPSI